MSNFSRPEYCNRCQKLTEHIWYDLENGDLYNGYIVECQECGERTPEEDFVQLKERS